MKKAAFVTAILIMLFIWLYLQPKDDLATAKTIVIDLASKISAYKEEIGEYPKSLSELVPGSIPMIPQLPIPDKSIYYSNKNGYYEISFKYQDTLYLYRSSSARWYEYRS